jgi:hypothetical protein
VFARLFQKAAGSKGSALGRLLRGEASFTPFNFAQRNMFFFAALCPKRTERIISM